MATSAPAPSHPRDRARLGGLRVQWLDRSPSRFTADDPAGRAKQASVKGVEARRLIAAGKRRLKELGLV